MTEAPERIWLQLGAGDYGTHTWCDQPQDWADDKGDGEPEYIRADLVEALEAQLTKADALADVLRRTAYRVHHSGVTTLTGIDAMIPINNALTEYRAAREKLKDQSE